MKTTAPPDRDDAASATAAEAPRRAEVGQRALKSAAAQLVVIALACAAVFGFVQAARSDDRRTTCSAFCALHPQYAGRNRLAPELDLKDGEGKPLRLADYRGKTVILNFWTKTCQPCLKEMPSLQELGKILEKRDDIVLLAVSTDAGPEAVNETLQVILEGEKPSFRIGFDPDLEVVRDKFGTKLFPETWIIDPQGYIRARFDGERNWASPFALEVAEMTGRGAGCPIDFDKGAPVGPHASLCAVD